MLYWYLCCINDVDTQGYASFKLDHMLVFMAFLYEPVILEKTAVFEICADVFCI